MSNNTFANIEELILADEDICMPYIPDMDDSEDEVSVEKVKFVVEKIELGMIIE